MIFETGIYVKGVRGENGKRRLIEDGWEERILLGRGETGPK